MGLERCGAWLLVMVLGATGTFTRDGHNWPLRMSAVSQGEIMLGAIFPVHESSPNFSVCGRIQLEDGIQPLEALLFTVARINSEKILPFKLGVIALDSCDNVVHALEQSLDFIKGFLSKANNNDDRRFTCKDGSAPKFEDGHFEKVIGVIGGQTSTVSIQVANVLRLFHVPQISYLSTSPSLSNKEMYNYFFRTVPSDINQAQIILAVLQEFEWTYVSLVYTNNDYGNKGFEELQKLAPKYNVCLALPQHMSVEHHRPSDYDAIVRNLLHKTNARVVVVYADKRSAQRLMEASKNHADERRFVWVGSDGWSARETVTKGLEKVIEGAITVQPMWGELDGFDKYFTALRPMKNTHNPWFDEFWEEFFKCRLAQTVPRTPFNDYKEACKGNLDISSTKRYKQQTYLHFVRDTAYVFAYALRDFHRDKCGNVSQLCAEMIQQLEGQQLKKYIQNVTFKDELGKTFRFLDNGDGPPRYSILNFQQNSKGNYTWSVVGSYIMGDDGNPSLKINKANLRFAGGRIPTSYCSSPCLAGQIKIKQEGDNCCWVCANCSTYQYLVDEYQCQECPWGTLPTGSKNTCHPIAADYIHYGNPYAISAMVLAGVGMVLTCAIAVIFWVYNDTPVIKAAGRELSYLLLAATFLSFALTFAIVAQPSKLVCGITRFSLGLCYTLCYGAVVTKTNRIARIFNARHSAQRRTRYTSPQSQIIITMMIASVEVIINGTWLLLHPPDVVYVHPSREEKVLICAGSEDASYLVGLIYPLILIGFCTVYAFKTRKCPDGFNEARFVAFTNYTTCIIWLAFVPLFFASGNNLKRTVTLSLSLSLSGTVQLGCLFVPKIYIVLLKPEKNTKENVMNQHRSAYIHSSSIGCGTTSPSIQINGSSGHGKLSHMATIPLAMSMTSSTIYTCPNPTVTSPTALSAITKLVASSEVGFIFDGVATIKLKSRMKSGHRNTL